MAAQEHESGPSKQTVMWRALKDRTTLPHPTTTENPVFVFTDFEGPQVVLDPIAKLMGDFVRPENASAVSPNYGYLIYQAGYDWFTEKNKPRRRVKGTQRPKTAPPFYGQEGTDTVFTLPYFLAKGVTDEHLKVAASEEKETPGARTLNNYIKKNGGVIMGITTAPSDMYQHVARNMGLDRLEGTEFSVDEAKQKLKASGKWDEEIGMVHDYLTDAFGLLDKRNAAQSDEEKSRIWEVLKVRTGQFYEDELGLAFDPAVRDARSNHKTVIGEMIENFTVVGDRTKAALALFAGRNNDKNVIRVKIGDGSNDAIMLGNLKPNDFSIALNGGPVDVASFGVVTPDVSTIKYLIDAIKANPKAGRTAIAYFAQEALNASEDIPEEVKQQTLFHIGGKQVSPEIRNRHKQMKARLRGDVG